MDIDYVDRSVVAPRPATVAGRRPLTFLFRGLVAFALLAPVALFTTSPVVAATIAATTTCSNGVANTGGLGLICQVTVVNTITASGGSARVTVRECHGAAGAPTAACSTKTTSLNRPVTAVTQCNASINGGGGTLRCSVVVTNNFYTPSATAAPAAPAAATAVTVDQCVGSGAGGIVGQNINCDPIPASTTGAAITQCNGSGNGLTLVHLNCTATGTMASALVVTINQCNQSANGGGALVECSASMANNNVTSTPPPTSPLSDGSSSSSTLPPFVPLICVAMGALGLAVIEAKRRRIRS